MFRGDEYEDRGDDVDCPWGAEDGEGARAEGAEGAEGVPGEVSMSSWPLSAAELTELDSEGCAALR